MTWPWHWGGMTAFCTSPQCDKHLSKVPWKSLTGHRKYRTDMKMNFNIWPWKCDIDINLWAGMTDSYLLRIFKVLSKSLEIYKKYWAKTLKHSTFSRNWLMPSEHYPNDLNIWAKFNKKILQSVKKIRMNTKKIRTDRWLDLGQSLHPPHWTFLLYTSVEKTTGQYLW